MGMLFYSFTCQGDIKDLTGILQFAVTRQSQTNFQLLVIFFQTVIAFMYLNILAKSDFPKVPCKYRKSEKCTCLVILEYRQSHDGKSRFGLASSSCDRCLRTWIQDFQLLDLASFAMRSYDVSRKLVDRDSCLVRDGCVAEVTGNVVHVLGYWHYYPRSLCNIIPCTVVSS